MMRMLRSTRPSRRRAPDLAFEPGSLGVACAIRRLRHTRRLRVPSAFPWCRVHSRRRVPGPDAGGKLVVAELEEVGGKKDRLVGKLQQKYGYAADEADRRADEWAKRQDEK